MTSKLATYKLTDQAMGALMLALQKSLLEQSDIVPMLKEMNFLLIEDHQDTSNNGLVVENPPVVSLEGVAPDFTIEEVDEVDE